MGAITAIGTVRGWPWPDGVLGPLAGPGSWLVESVDALGAMCMGWPMLGAVPIALALAWFPGRAPELRYRLALVVLAAGATMVCWMLGQQPGSRIAPVVIAILLATGLAMAARWRRDPAPGPATTAPPPWPWDLAAGLALALGALLAFAGIEREVGTNFYSHWQGWDALSRGEDLRSLLAISTGTARTSMDSGPYRLTARLIFALFGASWASLRALSALSLVAALALAHGLLARRLSAPAAVGATLLLGTSPLLLDLGHAPSFLGPSILLAVATVSAYAHWLDHDGARGGIILGLLLWLDLYGFAPLRPLLLLLPLAAGWLLLRPGRHRIGPRTLLPLALALLIPLLISLAFTGGDAANLVYADGEFLPAAGLADDARFRVIDAPEDADFVPRAFAEVLMSSVAGWYPGPNLDDGLTRPLTAAHVGAVVLGLLALAVRGLWRGRSAGLLTALLLLQLPLLALVYPVALRRMAVWFPCLLLVAGGGIELLLGGRGSERGPRAIFAGGVLAAMALLLVPAALGMNPRLARAPSPAERIADPCGHQRSIADDALARGYGLFSVQGPGDPTAIWSLCHPDVLGGNWGFYRWRALRDGGTPVSRATDEGAGLGALRVQDVGEDAAVFTIGDDDRLLFVAPGATVDGLVPDPLNREVQPEDR